MYYSDTLSLLSLSLQIMGNCSGKGEEQTQEGHDGMQKGTFTVSCINDDGRLVHKGKIVVTATELIYIQDKMGSGLL